MAIDMAKIQEYADRKQDIKARDKRLKEDKKKLESLEKKILNMFTEAGLKQIKTTRNTVFIATQLWASAPDIEGEYDYKGDPVKDYERACRALKDCGMGQFVKEGFNSQTLSSEIRAMAKSEEGVPEHLAENLKITERFYVKVK